MSTLPDKQRVPCRTVGLSLSRAGLACYSVLSAPIPVVAFGGLVLLGRLVNLPLAREQEERGAAGDFQELTFVFQPNGSTQFSAIAF